MSEWRIYYGDGDVVRGRTEHEWGRAPNGRGKKGVQVVVLMEPYPDHFGQPYRPWAGVDDRQLWTGLDTYDPFGWGIKYGRLIPTRTYRAIWKRACGDR